jgi:serine/threonine protein kinase/WD40 repeat protein
VVPPANRVREHEESALTAQRGINGGMAALEGDAFRVVGTVLERKYRVDRKVAEGGFGVVYAGHHLGLDVPVAIKLLKPDDSADDWLERLTPFFDEAKLIAKLRHPAIVAVLDSGVTHVEGVGLDVPWMVLEWIDGETLRAELTRRRTEGAAGRSPVECMDLVGPVMEAIAVAHEAGVVHRDLKPSNIMLTRDGKDGPLRARVLDFGVAKVMHPDEKDAAPSGDTATESRVSAFTTQSAAPEQLSGTRTGPWTDVFALALTLTEVLTGRAPWGTCDTNDHYRAVFAPERPTPARLGVDVGPWEPILARALAVRPTDRPKDARALLAELTAALATMDPAAAHATSSSSEGALPESGFSATERRGGDGSSGTSGTVTRARRSGALTALVAIVGLVALSAGAIALRRVPGPVGSATPVAALASAGPIVIAAQPVQLTNAGDCSGSPIFAEDGSIVFVRSAGGGSQLFRIDPATHEESLVTGDPGFSSRPAPGGPGTLAFSFRAKGRGVTEVRTVPLAGGPSRTLEKGDDPWVSGGFLHFLRGDDRAIRRHALDGGVDEVLFEAPSTSIFESLVVSPDARFVAATRGGLDSGRPTKPLCIGEVGSGKPLDCTMAGFTTARRATFSPDSRAVYLTREDAIVRVDLATHEQIVVPISPPPTSLAIAPDGGRMVMSTCHTVYDAVRVALDGKTTPLAAAARAVGASASGPRGELAFSVTAGGFTALAVAADGDASRRVLTSGERIVTELAFSPDGRRIAFHDSARDGGIFVVDSEDVLGLTRITTDPADSLPFWLDDEHVVYMHAEAGLPYGRVYLAPAAGGEPLALPKLPGTLVGTVPAKGTLLLAYQSPSGDRLVEATRTGQVHDVVLTGAPKDMRWELFTAASPSGRWLAWYSGGKAWRADLTTGKATEVVFDAPKGAPQTIQPDDEGRVIVSYRHSEGQLFEVRGTFR